MPTILRTEAKDSGGVDVFAQLVLDPQGPCNPVSVARLKAYFVDPASPTPKLTLTGLAFVDAVLVARVASAADAAKIAAVENAINAELDKRKSAVPDLLDKTPEDAVKSIWPALVAEVPK
ncbi:MAG TPA: hypothetical protein VM219_03645 [Phycisphaerae bacterium]|nr:hypothetical protein [Phycisphaerae bacterium]